MLTTIVKQRAQSACIANSFVNFLNFICRAILSGDFFRFISNLNTQLTLPGREIGCAVPFSGATLASFPVVIWTVPNFTFEESLLEFIVRCPGLALPGGGEPTEHRNFSTTYSATMLCMNCK